MVLDQTIKSYVQYKQEAFITVTIFSPLWQGAVAVFKLIPRLSFSLRLLLFAKEDISSGQLISLLRTTETNTKGFSFCVKLTDSICMLM